MIESLRSKAKELLQSSEVAIVIGYAAGNEERENKTLLCL